MVRDSIPPPFDMAYRPEGREVFGPPKWSWVVPVLYVAVALGFAILAESARFASPQSGLWQFFVEQDVHRIISARTFSMILALSALASILRTSMRGVIIHPDGIEARGALFGWPRIKTCEWVEIDSLSFEGNTIGIHLWNGNTLWLPAVAEAARLSVELERIATLRGIPMRHAPASVQVRHARA